MFTKGGDNVIRTDGYQYNLDGSIKDGPYIRDGKPNGRPTLAGDNKLDFENNVYDSQVDLDGTLRDPNTGETITWNPGESRKGTVDFGHVEGMKYSDAFKDYKSGKISLNELKEFQFNPENYQLETPSSNRSHLYEKRREKCAY